MCCCVCVFIYFIVTAILSIFHRHILAQSSLPFEASAELSIELGWYLMTDSCVSCVLFLEIYSILIHALPPISMERATNRYGKQVEALVDAKDSNMMTYLHLCLWVDASRSTIKRYAGQAFVHFVLCVCGFSVP